MSPAKVVSGCVARLHVQRTIAAPPERVFAWLADPVNLAAAPIFLKTGWRKDSLPPGVGAVREVVAVGAWLREEITAYDPPRSYSYRVVKSFPAADHKGGTISVAPGDRGTDVVWSTAYTVPFRGGGRVVEVATAPIFRWCFDSILAGCATALEN